MTRSPTRATPEPQPRVGEAAGTPIAYIYRKRRWKLLFGMLDAMGGIFSRPGLGTPDLSAARRILVLKLDQVGDLVLTEPLLGALRRAAPNAVIELGVGEGRAEAGAMLPGVDRLLELPVHLRGGANRIRWARMRQVLRELRSAPPDVAVAAKEDPITVLLARLTGAPRRIGYREGGLGFLLTHYLPVSGDRPQYLELAALAGTAGIEAGPPVLPLDETVRRKAGTLLGNLGMVRGAGLIVVHPGSGDASTRWPWPRFAETLERVSRRRPVQVVVVKPRELPSLPEFTLSRPSRVAVLDRDISLRELAALLAAADVFLGNESGPAHVAAAVGTPAVVPFLSGNDPRRWGPSGPLGHAVAGPRGVGPRADGVAEVVAGILDGPGMQPDRAAGRDERP